MTKILQNRYVLAVHDLHVSSAFFEKLGFEIIAKPDGWIFLKRDNCMVMFGECSDAPASNKFGDHSYFGYLRVDDADRYFKERKSKGVNILSPIETKPWHMREFAIATPEGHRIMIGQETT